MTTTRSREAITDWLLRALADIVGIAPEDIDLEQPFSYYGLGSTEAVMVIGELESWLGTEFPSTLAFDHPNVASLAAYLADTYAAPPMSSGDHASRAG